MKTKLKTSKYPEIDFPSYPRNFTNKELSKVKKIYRVSTDKAKEILREKFYGADKPNGFDSWSEYWKNYVN